VQVLEQKQVAGYDAAVLKADDPNALNDWRKGHGYQSSPAIQNWLKPYIRDHWIISAFKVVKGRYEGGGPMTQVSPTSAVRMTFSTDRPVFPYREPAGVQSRGPMRLFFVGPWRAQGVLGKDKWKAPTRYANQVRRAKLQAVLHFDAHLADTPWVTFFEDDATTRVTNEDLYFEQGPGGVVEIPKPSPHPERAPEKPGTPSALPNSPVAATSGNSQSAVAFGPLILLTGALALFATLYKRKAP
jgi:hypothetical protein